MTYGTKSTVTKSEDKVPRGKYPKITKRVGETVPVTRTRRLTNQLLTPWLSAKQPMPPIWWVKFT